MKNFLHKIGSTFYSEDIYNNARVESGWKGISFLVKVCLFLALLLGILAIIAFLLWFPTLKEKVLTVADEVYPPGLVITLKGGELSTNSDQPTIIPVPTSFAKEFESANTNLPDIKNMGVIAPNETSLDPKITETYNAYFVFTKTALIAKKSEAEVRTIFYGKENLEITESFWNEKINYFLNLSRKISPFVFIPMIFMFLLMNVVSHLWWLLVVSLLLYVIFKIKKVDVSYKEVFRMGIIALVPLVMIEILAYPVSMAFGLTLTGRALTTLVVSAIILKTVFSVKKDDSIASNTSEIATPVPPSIGNDTK